MFKPKNYVYDAAFAVAGVATAVAAFIKPESAIALGLLTLSIVIGNIGILLTAKLTGKREG